MNLAVRDIRHNLGRFLQTCVGLGLLLAVVMSMGGIYRGLVSDALSLLQASGGDLWVVQQDTNGPFAANSRIAEDVKYRIAAVPGVARASGVSFQNIQLARDGKPLRFFLLGYELGGLGGPQTILAGRGLGQKHYELVANKNLKIPLGGKIRLGLHDYTVVGLTDKMVASGGDPVAYVTLADAQEIQFQDDNDALRNSRVKTAARIAELSFLSPAQGRALAPRVSTLTGSTHLVNAVVAKLATGANLAEVQDRIRRWNHYRPISNAEQEELLTEGMISKAKQQLGLFRLILLVISAVIISLIIYTLTLDKLRVIATLKLIGAQNRVIVGLILEQSLLMGVVAYGVGYGIISATYDKFPRRVELVTLDLQVLFGIVIAICVVASLIGIRKALHVEAAEALGG